MPGTLLVPLTKGLFAVIDEADGAAVGLHTWCALMPPGRSAYAMTALPVGDGSYRHVDLHRFLWEVWGLPATPEIDHENTNGLDCRRDNLRPARPEQNGWNRLVQRNNASGFKGVSFHSQTGRWVAQIRAGGKKLHLGLFDSPEAAAASRREAAVRLHGEFAR